MVVTKNLEQRIHDYGIVRRRQRDVVAIVHQLVGDGENGATDRDQTWLTLGGRKIEFAVRRRDLLQFAAEHGRTVEGERDVAPVAPYVQSR